MAAEDAPPAPRRPEPSRAADEPSRPAPPARTRVVLAEASRRQQHRAAGAHTELAQQTRVGEALVRGLVRAQLALALQLSAVVMVGLGGLPWLFAIAPAVGRMTVLGVNLPWLLLGVLSFPFLVAVGWTYVRLAERNEQDFTDLVQRPEH
ncbi:hypothetical protein SAMN05443287_10763 [Micromonospora phaseoli]|uniref:Uncharacterized protein n=1 Tax=Micromonospora phaseoli TaxID=1144548 RepID=A0A1H7BG85_9ACTN|nr:hypothetical protein [Micromonospora phaseoli]PZV95159.1 hypothetical protein CLV64_108299 [Micromonospora phaseoli]GIJ78979.1 hypothetical protein Xph01_34110 [Micromonospora phaseoli]SEJ73552.1 hypothetical protein SAMN05443287_10763 [Micromonospora phaseoli]